MAGNHIRAVYKVNLGAHTKVDADHQFVDMFHVWQVTCIEWMAPPAPSPGPFAPGPPRETLPLGAQGAELDEWCSPDHRRWAPATPATTVFERMRPRKLRRQGI